MRTLALLLSLFSAVSSGRSVEEGLVVLLQVNKHGSFAGAAHLAAEVPASQEMGVDIESALITRIFIMCVIMYGGIGLLWGVNIQSGQPEMFKIGLLCISWASMSVGMHVLNKALVDYLQAPALISAFQMALTVFVVAVRSYQDVLGSPRAQILKWMVVPMFFAGMLISAFYAYARISLTLLTLVRNLTPLLMLPLETLVMAHDQRPTISPGVVCGILTMLVGAMIYSEGNLATISMAGVGFAFLNMFIAVTDRLIQRRLLTTECKDLSSGTCTILNNFWGMLPTLLLAGFTGQLHDATGTDRADRWVEPHVLVLLILSGLVGTGISILGLECQRAISATSFSVMQNVSKVAVVASGIVFFADPIGAPSSVTGLGLSLCGSFLYAWSQQQAAKVKADAKAAAAAQDGGSVAKVA